MSDQQTPTAILTAIGRKNQPGEFGINTTPLHERLFLRNDNNELVSFESTEELMNAIGDIALYWRNASGLTNITNVVDGVNDTAYWAANTFVKKPVTVYETDGNTGLLGVNAATVSENWQLTNLDLTPYKYIQCYFKVSDFKSSSNYLTPALVVTVPLDTASLAKKDESTTSPSTPCPYYLGSASGNNPSDLNTQFYCTCAVDSTKTKFQVVSQISIYGTAQGNRNSNGRYCYKITGHFE